MSILVNFEDSYGIADIACKYFFDEYIGLEYNEKVFHNNILVRRALTSGNIFNYRMIPNDISTIIFVYDMDRQSNTASYNILEPDHLKAKIDRLCNVYKDIMLKFVPVAFAAETICLHMMKSELLDFSQVFSKRNTANLHTQILTDILSGIHNDKNDRKYWSIHGQGKITFNIKRTRAYFEDLKNIDNVYMVLKNMNFSEMNTALFDWISGRKIEDVSKLLDAQQAIGLQKKYIEKFNEFLQQHDDYIDIENNRYILDYDYK